MLLLNYQKTIEYDLQGGGDATPLLVFATVVIVLGVVCLGERMYCWVRDYIRLEKRRRNDRKKLKTIDGR